MRNWRTHLKLRDLFTDKEDHASVQAAMNAMADRIEGCCAFRLFNVEPFRNIPKGDKVFGPVDYANRLIEKMYDYADDHDIWIE